MDISALVQIGTLVVTGVLVIVNVCLVRTTRNLALTAQREFMLARRSCVRAVQWRYDENLTQRRVERDTWPIRFDIAEMVGVPTVVESVNVRSYWNDREDKAEQAHVPSIPASIIKDSPVHVFVDRHRLIDAIVVEDANTSKEDIIKNRRLPPIDEIIIKGEFTYINTVDEGKWTVSFGATCRLANEPSRTFHIDKHPQTERMTARGPLRLGTLSFW